MGHSGTGVLESTMEEFEGAGMDDRAALSEVSETPVASLDTDLLETLPCGFVFAVLFALCLPRQRLRVCVDRLSVIIHCILGDHLQITEETVLRPRSAADPVQAEQRLMALLRAAAVLAGIAGFQGWSCPVLRAVQLCGRRSQCDGPMSCHRSTQ